MDPFTLLVQALTDSGLPPLVQFVVLLLLVALLVNVLVIRKMWLEIDECRTQQLSALIALAHGNKDEALAILSEDSTSWKDPK